MEEKPKRRSPWRIAVCVLLGAIAGLVGGIYGAVFVSGSGRNMHEDLALFTLAAGPLTGLGTGFAIAWIWPRVGKWMGLPGTGLLIVSALAGSAAMACLLVFAVGKIGRMS